MDTENPTIQINPVLEYALTDDGCVVLDIDAGEYVSFNPVATAIWRQILCMGNFEEVITLLGREYDVDEQRLRSDVHEFLESCRARGWIRVLR